MHVAAAEAASFYDLVIEVAIVRPGPIQGDRAHPDLRCLGASKQGWFSQRLRRRFGPANELNERSAEPGVPLFQEQAMKLAMRGGGFTPEEANGLRRAMATFRNIGISIQKYGASWIERHGAALL